MDKLNFIVIHHSSCEKDTELLINNILSIREFYPKNKIIIIKTSLSSIPFYILDENISIYNKSNDFTFIAGSLPLICNLLNNDDKYILIHDSMYLINKLPELILQNDIYSLWDFNKHFDFSYEDFNRFLSVINIDYPEILKDLYLNKYSKLWNGCFGPSFGGNINFLKKINKILNIEKNIDFFKGRNNLMLSERYIPLIIEYIRTIENNNEYSMTPILSLNKSIYIHPNSFRKEDNIEFKQIKKKAEYNNYNMFFYKLWFARN
jgi:hypothetical protein